MSIEEHKKRRRMKQLVLQETTVELGIAQRVIIHLSFITIISTLIAGWYIISLPETQIDTWPSFATAYSVDSSNSATLTWTSPGDDGDVGQATAYDIRYKTSPITDGNWSDAGILNNPPTPSTAGSQETLLVTGLESNTSYYFALKTVDENSNWSPLSNIATITTTCNEAWSCTEWSMCTNGTQTRVCSDLNNCGTTEDRPSTSRSCDVDESPPCEEDWTCTSWSECTDGQQARTCTDQNACGTNVYMPGESRQCNEEPDEPEEPGEPEPPVGGEPPLFQETFVVAAPSEGGGPIVRVLNMEGELMSQFTVYEDTFRGGVNLAVCDLGFDGIDEIVVGPGPGRTPLVRIFTWTGDLVNEFYAYHESFSGGVNVTCGNADNRGGAEIIITPASSGGSNVRIFSYVDGLYIPTIQNYFAYNPSTRGGFNLAITNFDGSSTQEIVTVPGPATGGPHVRMFEYIEKQFEPRILGFMAYHSSSRMGVSFCSGDTNDDGKTELFTAPERGGGPHVRKFGRRTDGSVGIQDPGFFVFHEDFRGGVSCAMGDFDYNDRDELVVAVRSGDSAIVKILRSDGSQVMEEFLAFPESVKTGVRIATGNFFNPL